MTILQADPVTILHALSNQDLGLFSLALTQGNTLQALRVVLGGSEVQEHLKWISTHRQNEDERGHVVSVLVNGRHGAVNRGDKEVAHLILHINLEGIQELFRPEHSE